MRKKQFCFVLVLFVGFIFSSAKAQLLSGGEKLYKYNCVSCHTIGKGVLEGPDLKNINYPKDAKWLFAFVRSSQNMIKKGDKKAIQLNQKFGNKTMPDFKFNDEQLKQLFDYIKHLR